MMFNITESPQQNRFAEDFLLSQLYEDWLYVVICVCLRSVADVMFSQQDNNFLLSIAIYIVGIAIN